MYASACHSPETPFHADHRAQNCLVLIIRQSQGKEQINLGVDSLLRTNGKGLHELGKVGRESSLSGKQSSAIKAYKACCSRGPVLAFVMYLFHT